MLKIHILFEQGSDWSPHGSTHVRLLRPLTHSANQEAFAVSCDRMYVPADVVIVERTWKIGVSLREAEELVAQTRRDRVCLIYTLDDNVLDLQLSGAFKPTFAPETPMAVRYLAREADGIIVSTEHLKQRYLRFNPRIHVVPNALDERICGVTNGLPPTLPDAKCKMVVGYMGTQTHDADLMMILQPLRAMLHKHRDAVEFQLIGGIGDAATMRAFAGLPVRTLDIGGNVEYPAFMRWMAQQVNWDLAVAPLEDNPFTRCKSDIKFLDYGILAIPAIFSQVPAYEKTVRHLETGYLARNDSQSWQTAFELMLNDESLRQRLGRNAQEEVLSTRTLQHCAKNWREAILAIFNSRVVVHVGEMCQ